jgi:hypothetical protein
MKNTLKIWGFIALAAVISLTLSCKQEEEKGVSLPSAPGIDKAPALPGDAKVPNLADAVELFEDFGGYGVIGGILSEAYDAAFDAAFKAANNGKSLDAWGTEQIASTGNTIKATVNNINGTKEGVTVKGKTSGEVTVKGLTIAEYFKNSDDNTNPTAPFTADGQSYSAKASANFTFEIPTLVEKNGWQVGGVITVTITNSYTETLKNKTIEEFAGKNSNETKFACALTIYNVASKEGARFRWATADKGSYNQRKISNGGYSEMSDLEVYGSSTLVGKALSVNSYLVDNVTNIALSAWDIF